ncbi:hypothetical protein NKR74_14645 [Bacillus sp. 3103sda1]|uniref:hypothetical protein n=1 Tax=Bacillus sp. 3103sda1 TaxID=2953808 RepID=UPI00209D089D|nr:hypothetical protein [Bacillus sp. 3103sda1]MCP1124527.1 hypothetical protein [Bacillus sp. 3103sda1]
MQLCTACEKALSKGYYCEYDNTYYCNMECVKAAMKPRCYNRLLKEQNLYWTVCKKEEEK